MQAPEPTSIWQQFQRWVDPIPPEHRDLAAAFEAENQAYVWHLLPPMYLVVIVSMSFFALADWLYYPAMYWQLLTLRFFGMIMPMGVLWGWTRARYGRGSPYVFFCATGIIISLTAIAMIILSSNWFGYQWVLLFLTVIIAAVPPWPVTWLILGSHSIIGLYVIAALFNGVWIEDGRQLSLYTLLLISAPVSIFFYIYVPSMRLRWENFFKQHKLSEAYALLQQYTEDLEASNAELDAFAHTVAHDLKTPLTALIGFGSLLQKHAARWPVEKIAVNADRITQTGHRMTNIINELLLLASVRKADEIELEPLDMSAIVEETLARFGDQLAHAEADLIMPETWPEAVGYAPWVEAVWVNYISNALKYGGAPPRVELGADEVGEGRVRFWVQDNGPGLTPEAQAKLFAEFTRLEKVRAKGHGLGLSIVLRIVAKLGGEVGVESEVGAGSRFWFELPKPKEIIA